MEQQTGGDASLSSGPSWMGCLIPIAAVISLLGLGTCTVLTGLLQNRSLAGFTEEEPRYYGVDSAVLQGKNAERLEEKLATLREAAAEGRAQTVAFSKGELNHLLQTRELLESLRETTRVREIGAEGIEVASSQAVRKLGSGNRYLNAYFVFRPVPSGSNTWQLELRDLRVPDREVPEGFLNMARELRLFRFDLEAEGLQEVLERIDELRTEPGELVVEMRKGGEPR